MGGARSARGSWGAGSPALQPVALDRRLSVATLVAALLFLWPLLVYGRPGYIQDSAAYYKGGRMAVTYVLDESQRRDVVPLAPRTSAASATTAQPNEVR